MISALGEREAEWSEAQGHPSLHSELKGKLDHMSLYSQKIKQESKYINKFVRGTTAT